MKYLSLLSSLTILLFSFAMQAQTLSNVTAELSRKIDTKNAHVGDAVEAKTTSAATLPDGTQLPKGTKLVGKLTQVRAKSSADKSSHLAFSLDKAILHDGHEVPIHTTLSAMSVPSVAAETGAATSVAADTDMPAMRGAGGGTAPATLTGGATRSGDQVTAANKTAVANAVTGTASPAQSGSAASTAPSEVITSSGANAVSGPHVDHIAVGYLPGVTFSSALLAADTGSLDASGQNISVEGGTMMTLILRGSQQ